MNPIATALTETLDAVRKVHLPGHRCTDGRWYNAPVKGAECPTAQAMTKAARGVTALAEQTYAAAADPAAVRHVCWAMTGFDSDTLDSMDEEQRDGWLQTAKDAITGLSFYLDGDPDQPQEQGRHAAEA